ncbi:anti-CBASS protein Acb1 family protein [Parapusillimonas sp. JC17]|uniref:phage portal protein n=1 Tax=Parapusillimonas sp. JC17 TaxID=3445768 RepID=UPI003FA10F1A
MGVSQQFADGLVNVVANLGTPRDKAAHSQYVHALLTPQQLLDAYRNAWLARAIVDYPAEDATRKWRTWRAKADQITKIERLEKALGLQRLVQDAMVAARLYGGAAIYINTADDQQDQPLRPGKEIRSLVVLTPNSLQPDPLVRDIDSEYYGWPEHYTLTASEVAPSLVLLPNGARRDARVRVHASRLVVLRGASVPNDPSLAGATNSGWGDSVLQATLDAIQQVDSTMANIASLVFEAKVDVFKFDSFAQLLEDNSNDALLTRRLQTQAAMKGINGAVVIDMKDDYQQKSATFTGLPDVVSKFMDAVSGASRIPVTRLYGRAAVGLSGSGDGDERVYFDRIGHIQATEVGPAMALLDDCIIHQALQGRPEEIYYEWAPLRQLTEAERAEIFVKTSNAARALAGPNAGPLMSVYALSDALVNELTEQGVLPGLDQAVKKHGTLEDEDGFVGPEDAGTPSSISDAAPRTLYVSRKVLNAAAIQAHYKAQGIDGLVDTNDMHVTITYSRQPVDWMKMGEAWAADGDGSLTISAGGARLMEVFGPNRDTAVLAFVSSNLSWRHEDMVRNGASWDWPEYQPHISISYAFTGDISAVEPWRGEIRLGPEIFEEINEDWKSKVSE